jgi:hypothetical protein
LRLENGVVRASARPEAVAVLAEGRIKDRLQHLQQGLLDQTIRHRRDAKLALATVRLGDRHPPYRQRPVLPRQQLLADDRPRRAQMDGGLVDVQSVDPGCPFVGPYPFPRPLQVLSRQRRQKQPWPCVPRLTARAAGFVADRARRGFTAPFPGPPRWRGHLTRCPPHRHDGKHSSSFGPSPATRSPTTTTSADFSLRLDAVALSGIRRDLPR